MKKRIVIFASGSGTNTQNVIQYFQQSELAEVVHVLTNKKSAKVLDRAENLNIPTSVFNKEDLISEDGVLALLTTLHPDLIVLAGFLLKIPGTLLKAFPKRILNIHPALLPKYGGKGMYGMYVHEAVVANKETETGITIHFVNEHYDEGAIIFQQSVSLSKEDTPQDVAAKIHALEYEWFPKIIEKVLLEM
ncbi:phosphoribosylglycinamide formyltransferase [Cochleicola gelatinilyticus]|uniref:Phosphoribosylglycinamide formyltransferase n=1 Tax=Cochleicola gelatinilyticus TaxID=1763537 RepID=A0A167J475_9FLAO|nr:phosphoribosylglycinamide formyltransferase [Cochleicola gelatinilyticus]OAB80318.1 phosphoribosylglycinamide formyltransferase [Cochleicola gelatinilyticus]